MDFIHICIYIYTLAQEAKEQILLKLLVTYGNVPLMIEHPLYKSRKRNNRLHNVIAFLNNFIR